MSSIDKISVDITQLCYQFALLQISSTKATNDKPQYVCPISGCERIYTHTWHFQRHLDWHSGKTKFFCEHCNKGFVRKDALCFHVRVHELPSKKPRRSQRPNRNIQQSHRANEPGGKAKYACFVFNCERIYCSISSLNRHFRQKHGLTKHVTKYDTLEQPGKFQYPKCRVQGANETMISKGKLQHVNYCKKRFEEKGYLSKQLKVDENSNCRMTRNGNNANRVLKCTQEKAATIEVGIRKAQDPQSEALRAKSTDYSEDSLNYAIDDSSNQNNRVSIGDVSSSLLPITQCETRYYVQDLQPELRSVLSSKEENPNVYCSTEDDNNKPRLKRKFQHDIHIAGCGSVFGCNGDLKRYSNFGHSGKKNFFCADCDKKFERKGTLREHVKIHMIRDEQGHFQSRISSLNSENKIRDMHPKEQKVAVIIGREKLFGNVPSLKKHLKIHDRNNNFLCAYCNKNFEFLDHLKKHVEEHINSTSETQLLKNLYQMKGQYSNGERTNKIEDLNGKPQRVSSITGRDKFHINTADSKVFLISNTSSKDFICMYCDKRFARKDVLNRHVKTHTSQAQYPCTMPDCKRVYKYESSLNRHLRQNHDLKPLVTRRLHKKKLEECHCPNCSVNGGNQTKGPNGLSLHICRHCKRDFTLKDLKGHLKWYSSKENFFCAHCPKGFVRKNILSRHVKIHIKTSKLISVKQEYACPISDCKRVYRYAGYFKKHVERHSDAQKN